MSSSCLNHDDAVRGLGPVLRRGRRVLEHLNGLDVVRVEIRILRQIHAVDDVQRRRAAEAILSSHDDLCRPARLAGRGHLHAGNAATDRLFHRGNLLIANLRSRHARDGAGDVPPLLGRVAHRDDGGEIGGKNRKLKVGDAVGAVRDRDALRDRRIPDPLSADDVAARRNAGEGVLPLIVGHGAQCRVRDRDLSARKRLPGFAEDGTGDAAAALGVQCRSARGDRESSDSNRLSEHESTAATRFDSRATK